uniref:Uncharacterized protein n=2 Tax=Caenorhabditis japonica TaxID=281687 RepID=A0A8R1E5Q1_CAEJA
MITRMKILNSKSLKRERESFNNLRYVRNSKLKSKEKTLRAVAAARYNPLLIGGMINMVLALLNLFFALLNFALINGKYNTRLRILAEKVRISLEEIASRDMHPKIKMALSRRFAPKDALLSQVLQLLKEPSEYFGHANDLLPGQIEKRLGRLDAPPNTNTKSTASKKTGGKKKNKSKEAEENN